MRERQGRAMALPDIQNLPRRSLGGLQFMLPLKPACQRMTRRHLADAVAHPSPPPPDEADIIRAEEVSSRASTSSAFANFLTALHLLDPDREQAQPLAARDRTDDCHGACPSPPRHQMLLIAADGGAESSTTDRRALWPYRCDRRRVDPPTYADGIAPSPQD